MVEGVSFGLQQARVQVLIQPVTSRKLWGQLLFDYFLRVADISAFTEPLEL